MQFKISVVKKNAVAYLMAVHYVFNLNYDKSAEPGFSVPARRPSEVGRKGEKEISHLSCCKFCSSFLDLKELTGFSMCRTYMQSQLLDVHLCL